MERSPAVAAQPGSHRARHAKPGRVRTLVTAAQSAATELSQVPEPRPAEVVAEDDWVQAVRTAPLRESGRRENAGVAATGDVAQVDLLGAISAATPDETDTTEAPKEQAEYSVDVMLSLLAAERNDGLATWSNRLDGPGAKLAVVAGGALALTLLGVVGLAILGLLFG